MANPVREYLTFTKKERNGLLVLISLITLVLVYLNLDPNSEIDDNTELTLFENELAELEQASADQEAAYKANLYSTNSGSIPEASKELYVFHEFDPNFVTDQEWVDMGLKNWQVNGLRNYREKAGDIETPEQFSKLHVITDEFFEKVQSYLVFESNEEKPDNHLAEKTTTKDAKPQPLSIELNIASAARLTELKGIGPAYSDRIVKYRNWLGGFRNMNQLLEVYGLEDSLYYEIIPFLTLDTARIRKININKVAIRELQKHPYVKWNVARAIVNYRDQHGDFTKVSDIKKTDLVSPELYRKIAPYLEIGEN